MVSFEAQEKADFLIQQVKSIELANHQALLDSRRVRLTRSTGGAATKKKKDKTARRANTNAKESATNMQSNTAGTTISMVETEIMRNNSSGSEPQPLADDLSSHMSESDYSDAPSARSAANEYCDDDDNGRLGNELAYAYDEYGINMAEWREHAMFLERAAQMGSIQAMYDSTMACRQAMHQIMLNADLKMRKLQYEVFMLRRIYEDAILTIERSEQKTARLERKLSDLSQSQGNNEKPVFSEENVAADLRMANHLNKLMASRNKALDENLQLKKQLLSCCSRCRSRMVKKHTNNAVPEEAIIQQSQPTTPQHRPTFQKTAHAMVQRLGQKSPHHHQSSKDQKNSNPQQQSPEEKRHLHFNPIIYSTPPKRSSKTSTTVDPLVDCSRHDQRTNSATECDESNKPLRIPNEESKRSDCFDSYKVPNGSPKGEAENHVTKL